MIHGVNRRLLAESEDIGGIQAVLLAGNPGPVVTRAVLATQNQDMIEVRAKVNAAFHTLLLVGIIA